MRYVFVASVLLCGCFTVMCSAQVAEQLGGSLRLVTVPTEEARHFHTLD